MTDCPNGEQPPSPSAKPLSPAPLFSLGQLVATPGALTVLEQFGVLPIRLIARHVHGDFGELDDADRQGNLLSLQQGFRIFSAYTSSRTVDRHTETTKVWCITEADRSVTTLLLPEEY